MFPPEVSRSTMTAGGSVKVVAQPTATPPARPKIHKNQLPGNAAAVTPGKQGGQLQQTEPPSRQQALRLPGGPVRCGLVAAFLGDRVGAVPGRWRCLWGVRVLAVRGLATCAAVATCRRMLGNPRRTRPGVSGRAGSGGFLPGAAQVGGVRPGEQQLGVGGHDKADPPAGLGRGADLGGGEPEAALEEPEGVLVMRKSALGALCGGAGNAARTGVRAGSGGDRAAAVRIITAIRGR